MPQPDYHRSMIINALLQDYHALTPDLKFLRAGCACQRAPCLCLPTEQARHRATGWFNRVYLLYRAGLLAPEDLQLIAQPAGVRLWLAHVLPLDVAVREAAHGKAAEGAPVPDIEAFWREYADGQLRVYTREAVH